MSEKVEAIQGEHNNLKRDVKSSLEGMGKQIQGYINDKGKSLEQAQARLATLEHIIKDQAEES